MGSVSLKASRPAVLTGRKDVNVVRGKTPETDLIFPLIFFFSHTPRLPRFFSSSINRTTQFVLVFFACVLLTLRAAFYDIEVERGDGTSKDGSPVNEDQYDEVMDFSEEDGGQEIRSTAYGKKDPGWNIRF